MRVRRIVTALAVLAVTAGCGAATRPDAPVPPAAATEQPAPDFAAAENPVVNTVPIGQPFPVTDDTGAVMADVTVTAVEVGPPCPSPVPEFLPAPTPVNGTFVAVAMDVATTADYDPAAFSYPSGFDFSVIGADGYTVGQLATAETCLSDRDAFTTLTASGKFRGWVLLDVPADSMSLTFRPHFALTYPGVSIPLP